MTNVFNQNIDHNSDEEPHEKKVSIEHLFPPQASPSPPAPEKVSLPPQASPSPEKARDLEKTHTTPMVMKTPIKDANEVSPVKNKQKTLEKSTNASEVTFDIRIAAGYKLVLLHNY